MESGLYVVSTPIGNLSDLTDRAREVLRTVPVVFAEDTRRTGRLLTSIDASPELVSLHEHNEASRVPELLERLEAGSACALVSDAGVPSVSDPGRRAVRAALEGGHAVRAVPGASAVTAALSVAGLPADRFVFLGFPPRSGGDRERWLERCAALEWTGVTFESPRRVADLLEDWEARGLGDRRCVVCRELTKLHEELIHGTVSEMAARIGEAELRGEVTIVLAGGEPAGWEARRDEVEAVARELVEQGLSTRDVAERLQSRFDVPRNAAYELALARGNPGGGG